MSASQLLNHLDCVRSVGHNRWLARCPAHQDRDPSLSVRELEDGGLLIHCFAGCAAIDVVSSVGLAMRDLFPQVCRRDKPVRPPLCAPWPANLPDQSRPGTPEHYEAARAAGRAARIWERGQPAGNDHPYLVRKGVEAHGLRIYRGKLVIAGMGCDGALIAPARNGAGEISTLGFISPDGEKRFLPGGVKRGCYYGIGRPREVVCVAEGFATAASIHEATGYAVAVAFDAGNLEHVARALRIELPSAHIVVCADDDYDPQCATNPGLTFAWRAASAVGGLAAIPALGDGRGVAGDFNDLALAHGREAVRGCFARLLATSPQPASQECA